MDGQTEEWMDDIEERMDNGWIDGQTDGRRDEYGWMDRQMNGWMMDGRMGG